MIHEKLAFLHLSLRGEVGQRSKRGNCMLYAAVFGLKFG
jgi:hypothetical protein